METKDYTAGPVRIGRSVLLMLLAYWTFVFLWWPMRQDTIGMSFGAGDYAHDIRLACHGLDKEDNDFVIGLIGKELYPLSALVQTMRKTQQTSLYLERLGPFFVGRAVWQSGL